MPAVPPQAMVGALLNAFIEAGCQAQLTSAVRNHPRSFLVIPPEGNAFTVWIYIWSVTHGGFPRSETEFRIQMTSVVSPLPLNPAGLTVLMGYDANLGVFAGFDLVRHRTFTTGSPSVQIALSALQSALNFGFGFSTKDNGEIAIAFRPSQILAYIQNSQAFHEMGVAALAVATRVAALQPVPPAEIEAVPEPRRRIVETVTRLARVGNFRDQVMSAYDNRCAVSRVQLKLVEAAHVLPVGAEGSTDLVTNGISLAPSYHKAFDQGLIYLDEDRRMQINQTRVDQLNAWNLAGGLADFTAYLGNPIHLPANQVQRPSLEMIRRANTFRRIRVA